MVSFRNFSFLTMHIWETHTDCADAAKSIKEHTPSSAVLGLVAQLCPTLCDPMDLTCKAPLSMGFSRQQWSGWPFPSPGTLPNPQSSPSLQADSLSTEPPGTANQMADRVIRRNQSPHPLLSPAHTISLFQFCVL